MIECCVARDLLPLYEDKVVAPMTAQLLCEHLDSCPECRAYYADIRHQVRALPPEPEHEALYADLMRRVRRRALLYQATAALLLAALGYGLAKHTREGD